MRETLFKRTQTNESDLEKRSIIIVENIVVDVNIINWSHPCVYNSVYVYVLVV